MFGRNLPGAGAESRRTIIYLFYLFFRSLSRGFTLFALHVLGLPLKRVPWIRGLQKLDAYPQPPLFNLTATYLGPFKSRHGRAMRSKAAAWR